MKTISYVNCNGDTILIDVSQGIIQAVYLFGINILTKLTEYQLNYLYEVIV